LIGLSCETLTNLYKTNFILVQEHKYSLTEIENMIPWERNVYINLLIKHMEELNKKREELIRKQKRK
jgi:hypothetical protein